MKRTKKNRLLPLNRQEAGKVPNIHSIRVFWCFSPSLVLYYTQNFPKAITFDFRNNNLKSKSYETFFSPLWSLLPGAALIAGCGNPSKKETTDNTRQKPNVIYLIADDLGIGDLSCYGATKISTPNIDRLAGQGVQFTNAYATSSTSTPSRFGLLTGMYPWRQENTGIAPGNSELIIDTACVTMADMFKAEGYATGAVGKWHLGLGPKGGTDFNHLIKPNTQDIGFDYEYIIPATVDRVPCVFVENGHVVGLDPNDPITVNYNHKVGDWPTGLENPELVKLKPSQGHNNTIVNGIPRIGWMTGGKSALWVDEDIADVITGKSKRFYYQA